MSAFNTYYHSTSLSMQIVFSGDNLREMSKKGKRKPVLWEKIRKKVMNLSSVELAQRVIKVQIDNESLILSILLVICVDQDQTARECRFTLV